MDPPRPARSYTSGRARLTSASRRATVGSPAKRRRARARSAALARYSVPSLRTPSDPNDSARRPARATSASSSRHRSRLVSTKTSRFRWDPHSCARCYLRPVGTLDDRVTIATPEGVELELVLAGVGSRFAASLLDVVIQLGAIFALAVVLGPLGNNGYVLAAYLVAIFLILFAYDIALETWNPRPEHREARCRPARRPRRRRAGGVPHRGRAQLPPHRRLPARVLRRRRHRDPGHEPEPTSRRP